MESQQTISKVNYDNKGRFVKGSCPNPKGNNQFTSIVPLITALEKKGIEHGQPFFEMVAEKCYGTKNESLLIAVLKKILPDQIKGEGFASGVYVYIIKDGKLSKECGDNRVSLHAAPKSAVDKG